ncbi:hypothetical protein HMPREF9140_01312 [Prevotella micans F0438]|uniref:Uncharacterized protein n=1 Tax=Prevotella micans F0438 TaxID=883158 RepID=H1Q324_9BACT|nr:hypothetical protein HMPREF9140_01312 [Prevotella micans F0438]
MCIISYTNVKKFTGSRVHFQEHAKNRLIHQYILQKQDANLLVASCFLVGYRSNRINGKYYRLKMET